MNAKPIKQAMVRANRVFEDIGLEVESVGVLKFARHWAKVVTCYRGSRREVAPCSFPCTLVRFEVAVYREQPPQVVVDVVCGHGVDV